METSDKPSFHLGGQALIEGVLMRSPHYVAAAVRRADGTIEARVEPFQSVLARHKWLQIPLLRGTIALFEMLLLGMRYLHWSSEIALQDGNTHAGSTTSTPSAVTGSAANGETGVTQTGLTGAVATVLSTPVATTKHNGTPHPNGGVSHRSGVGPESVKQDNQDEVSRVRQESSSDDILV